MSWLHAPRWRHPGSGSRRARGRITGPALLLGVGLACALAAGCDSPTSPTAQLDLAARREPLRGAYGLPAPVAMSDGRRLYWAQLSFWGKHDPAEGQDTWSGSFSVKDGGDCLAGLAWGLFTLNLDRVGTGSPAFTDAVLSGDRKSIEVTIDADGTPVRTKLVLDVPSPL